MLGKGQVFLTHQESKVWVQSSFQHFLSQNDSSTPVSPFAPAQHGVGVDGTFHTSLGPKRDCGITIYKHQVEHKAAISPEALESEPGFGCSDFCLPHYNGNIF